MKKSILSGILIAIVCLVTVLSGVSVLKTFGFIGIAIYCLACGVLAWVAELYNQEELKETYDFLKEDE